MRACADCKHHRRLSTGQDICAHPETGGTSVRFARGMLFGTCGPAADLFEEATPSPPPTRWQRIKAFVRRVWPW